MDHLELRNLAVNLEDHRCRNSGNVHGIVLCPSYDSMCFAINAMREVLEQSGWNFSSGANKFKHVGGAECLMRYIEDVDSVKRYQGCEFDFMAFAGNFKVDIWRSLIGFMQTRLRSSHGRETEFIDLHYGCHLKHEAKPVTSVPVVETKLQFELRDFFAGMAMTGQMVRTGEAWAQGAYEIADAMIAERATKRG